MSIFQTQADQYQNSYQGQPNMAYYGNGWGIDPNLMTPAYSAPYRPQFLGSNPYAPVNEPGFFRSVGTLVNPMYGPPMWQNSSETYDPYANKAVTTPADSLMWGLQRIAAPAAIYHGMDKMMAPGLRKVPGAGKGPGLWNSIKHPFQAKTFAGAAGKGFAQGVASPFLRQGGRAMGAVGAVGSLAGSFALPYAATEVALAMAERVAFSPYTNTRRTANQLQENFSNVTFSDADGRNITGRGLSGAEAGRFASGISKQGILDAHFSTSEYTDLANFSAKSGLLDSVKAQALSKSIKDISEQVKLIISISKDPSVEGAIEELYKLSSAGASTKGGRFSAASGAYSQLGSYASQAEVSVQKLMSTVGQQGQMLYQMNGMTPYLGQMAAANVYAGFAAAKRTGVMSSSMLARMGGVEGATQSTVAGQVASVQTPYAQMAAYNQYLGGYGGSSVSGTQQNVTSTVAAFGNLASRNPLLAQGNVGLYGPAMASKMLAEQGSDEPINQAISILKSASLTPAGAEGSWSAGQLYAALTGSMGQSPDQARAIIANYASSYDPETRNTRQKAATGFAKDQQLNYLDQYGLTNSAIGGVVNDIGRFARRATAETSTPFRSAAAGVQEATQAVGDAFTNFWYGNSLPLNKTSQVSVEDLVKSGSFSELSSKEAYAENLRNKKLSKDPGESLTANFKLYSTGVMGSMEAELIGDIGSQKYSGLGMYQWAAKESFQAINEILKDPSNPAFKQAVAFQTAKTREEKTEALRALMKAAPGVFQDADFKNRLLGEKSDLLDSYLNLAESSATTKFSLKKKDFVSVSDKVKRISENGSGIADTSAALRVAMKIGESLENGKVDSKNINDLLKNLTESERKAIDPLVKGKSGSEAISALRNLMSKAGSEGMDTLMMLADESYGKYSSGQMRFSNKEDDDAFRNESDKNKKMEMIVAELSRNNPELSKMGVAARGSSLAQEAQLAAKRLNAARTIGSTGKSAMDIAEYQKTSKSLEVGQFNDAVTKFSDAVGDFRKGLGSSSSGESKSWSFGEWSGFNNSAVGKAVSSNQRVQESK